MYKCKKHDCMYCRIAGAGSDGSCKVCHYMLDTGEKRNCPADQCDKYTPIVGKRKRNAFAVKG